MNIFKSFLVLLILLISNGVLAQPSNDECFGAISLSPSSTCVPVTGTVSQATQSIPGCTGTADDDVWYSFVATQSNLSVIVSGTTGFNPVVQVFSGGCISQSSLACVNNTGNGGTEAVSLTTLIVGVTYHVRVYHFAATAPTTPTFTICVSQAILMPNCATSPPAGNTCDAATFICDVNGYCGNTISYTPNSWPALSSAFCGSIENNSFIQFVANASTVSLNVWVTSSTTSAGIQVMIFSIPSCGGAVTNHTCVSPVPPTPSNSLPTVVTATGLIPGNTYYMMIDGFGGDQCNYVIGVNSGIQVSGQISAPSTNLCIGNSVTLTASGGNGIYNWIPNSELSTTSGPTNIATPLTQGPHTYSMTSISLNPSCPTDTVDIVINAYLPPTPNAGIDDSVCLGQVIQLSGTQTSTANTMNWTFNTSGITPTPSVSFSPNFSSLTPNVTVNQPGTYRFILRETNTVCGIVRDTVYISVIKAEQLLSSVQPSCFGFSDGKIIVDNPIASSYSFDNGVTWQTDSVKTGFAAGTYTVCSKNYLNCQVCSSITVVNPAQLSFTASNDTIICQNGTANLSALATGGNTFNYTWNFTNNQGNNQDYSPLNDTIITVFATSDLGCVTSTESITIQVRDSLSGTISTNLFVCPGYPATINVTTTGGIGAPYNYNWSNGQTFTGNGSSIVVSPTALTQYGVTITDACESTPLTLSTTVDVLPLPIPQISSPVNEKCERASFTLQNETDPLMTDHLVWHVSNGTTFIDQETIEVDDLMAGNYTIQLIVTSPQGCIDSTTFPNFLTVHPKPESLFKYTPNPVKMFNTLVNLTNYSSNGASFEWFITNGNPAYSNQPNVTTIFPDGVTGEYPVLLITTSDFGCIDSLELDVIVLPELIIYAPNTFTPDNDEHNQNWGIYIEGIDITEFNLLIFNRWGEIIWESNDPKMSWDGTFNGKVVSEGTYNWTIQAKDLINDGKYNFNGYINVIR
jgi:gliding motility-associated-like protein